MKLLENKEHTFLSKIDNVEQLRLLKKKDLPFLCEDLRNYLLETVSISSGHLASGLGVVELTVAIHFFYNTPFDLLIWDVGHQAYPHKILTGRKKQIKTIRQRKGLHPFPCREESKFDVASVGHSSTSLSIGLGLSIISSLEKIKRHTICVIGDGALTSGIAFEALNHIGDIQSNILIILNDNNMSISKNVGAINNTLLQNFFHIKHSTFEKKFVNLSHTQKNYNNVIKALKKDFVPSILFKELGFNYIGPVDGHNVIELIKIFKNISEMQGPQFLHILTKKGKGYAPAENDPIAWHAVPKFCLNKDILPKKFQNTSNYSQIFGDWLCEIASIDSKLMAITPAMSEGSGMVKFSHHYPRQYFDVAIAEQHAVTLAAGMAIGGYKPIVAIYSTFLQRAYDQVIHDVAIQKLPVLFAIDRSGIVGEDGRTHQGAFDIAFLRCIPNMIIMTPSDENELRSMLYTGYKYKQGPCAVRYPRRAIAGNFLQPFTKLPIGKGLLKRKGKKIAFLNFGMLLKEVSVVAELMNSTLIDMRFVKPLDQSLIIDLTYTHEFLVTVEEGTICGGAGSGVNELIMKNRKLVSVLNLGIPDEFIPHGNQKEILCEYGLNAKGIRKTVHEWIKSNKK
ncbi:1-deoxy-D-xylulose-5-phosphate synthase [Candidatus Tachikawaea gelatinosa]|uniref:1-deoxy-D-xylulose-5-phosphate synthase n=1 Tax=Candidatus Tachikawaea gelatinosa TaxID=1410383 RepID=A0A090BWK3_9ENTR|nr:1-deoxy-D-xylulose-5-phosphate synthase [Candidatus Tachikawaea gelatinosa]BAP58756.1 1-deoxy-D-xylulose-5-phosphate synthase [Candidatus Tachikawaea gelatinosa]